MTAPQPKLTPRPAPQTAAWTAPEPLWSRSGRVRAMPPTPGTEYWRLTVHDSDGRRGRRTTGGRTRGTAKRRLLELDRQLAAEERAVARAAMLRRLWGGHRVYLLCRDRGEPAPPWSLSSERFRELADRFEDRPQDGPR